MNNYIIRKAYRNNDDKQLNTLLTEVFYPEEVGVFAEVLFNHFPGTKADYWFIAEEQSSTQMVSAFTLIPWIWEMNGIKLKTAEMGLVGTLEEHRGRGLMRLLNREFDKTLEEEQFDLAVIQGIPGFYHKFGFHYAVALENHIHIPLKLIEDRKYRSDEYTFRQATNEDIPFLMEEDKKYRSANLLSVVRKENQWNYLMTDSLKTECASEYWIMEHRMKNVKFYFKILLKGFGKGLILSEISEDISLEGMNSVLAFCRQKAIERKKPYIRLNLHTQSEIVKQLSIPGIEKCKTYAWQIKIPDKIRFLIKLKPILEERINKSEWTGYSGVFRINLYSESIDMHWLKGRLKSVSASNNSECHHTFCIGNDLFPSLVLGHRSWDELQFIRPDTSPELLYIKPTEESLYDKTGSLVDTLFPKQKSWIYLQY